MQQGGLSHRLATWFLNNCPNLQLLRDVCSWSGDQEDWARVASLARDKGIATGWAEKTRKVSLYTIDYDSEGWVQADTGHQFELYNNLNDDWEVVEMDNVEEIQIVDEALQLQDQMEEGEPVPVAAAMVDQIVDQEMGDVNVVDLL